MSFIAIYPGHHHYHQQRQHRFQPEHYPPIYPYRRTSYVSPRERYFRAINERAELEEALESRRRGSYLYDSYQEELERQQQQAALIDAIRRAHVQTRYREQQAELERVQQRRMREERIRSQQQHELQVELMTRILTAFLAVGVSEASEPHDPEGNKVEPSTTSPEVYPQPHFMHAPRSSHCHERRCNRHHCSSKVPVFAMAACQPQPQHVRQSQQTEAENGTKLKRKAAMRRQSLPPDEPATSNPIPERTTTAADQKANAPTTVANTTDSLKASRRTSLESLGLIRAEFDLARLRHSSADSKDGSEKAYEEKLVRLLERVDAVELPSSGTATPVGDEAAIEAEKAVDSDTESIRTIRRTLARDLNSELDGFEKIKVNDHPDENIEKSEPVKKVRFQGDELENGAGIGEQNPGSLMGVEPIAPFIDDSEKDAFVEKTISNLVAEGESDVKPEDASVVQERFSGEDLRAYEFSFIAEAALDTNSENVSSRNTEKSNDLLVADGVQPNNSIDEANIGVIEKHDPIEADDADSDLNSISSESSVDDSESENASDAGVKVERTEAVDPVHDVDEQQHLENVDGEMVIIHDSDSDASEGGPEKFELL